MATINCTDFKSNYRHPNFIDKSGFRFGRLTVQTCKGKSAEGKVVWSCLCDCGNLTDVVTGNLTSGSTSSCGCVAKELKTKHGLHGTPEYLIWVAMWKRCTNEKDKDYVGYKNRRPPEVWRDFSIFIKDMGRRPSPLHSIERVDNDAPYGPDNCIWGLTALQAKNTKANRWLEHDGKRMTITDWARYLQICPATLRERLEKWSLDRALSETNKRLK